MRHLIPAALLCCAVTAHAQVFRCTSANGKVEFSDSPCATSSTDARVVVPQAATGDRALQTENERLRLQLLEEQNRRLRAENDAIRQAPPAASAPAPDNRAAGRTQADLQAERADTYECQQARRNYEVALSSITNRNTAPAAKASMYSACGMQPPSETTIRVRPDSGNCIRRGNILQCN